MVWMNERMNENDWIGYTAVQNGECRSVSILMSWFTIQGVSQMQLSEKDHARVKGGKGLSFDLQCHKQHVSSELVYAYQKME